MRKWFQGWTALVAIALVPTAAPAEEERVLTTNRELASYALGVQIAFSIRQQSSQFDMDPQAVAMALEDVLSGREIRYPPAQLQMAMVEYQAEIKAKRETLAADNLKAAVAFLDANRTEDGVEETDSGLQYRVIETGDGEPPAPGDQVLVHYRGTLLDGTEFDSSYSRGEPTSLRSDQVIPAWQEALTLMKPGSKWEIYVHPALGYGEQGSGRAIGPNQAMIFLVELIEVQ